jgi:hypothetical protein
MEEEGKGSEVSCTYRCEAAFIDRLIDQGQPYGDGRVIRKLSNIEAKTRKRGQLSRRDLLSL